MFLPLAVIDVLSTLREKFPLEAAVLNVSAAALAFGSVSASLNIRSTSATTDPGLSHNNFCIVVNHLMPMPD